MAAKIKEIFESVQGEGILIGIKQIFIRFAYCNLNCAYCDTNHGDDNVLTLSEEELFDKIKKMNSEIISFTGGEPLIHADFIKSFINKYNKFLNKEIYLETNGTMHEELLKIIDVVDVVAMDVKIKSATGEENMFEENERFLEAASNKAFLKVVFTKDITPDEIDSIIRLCKKYNPPLILQPKSPLEADTPYLEIYNKFFEFHKDTRLIPQTHKFLNIA